MKQLKDLPDRFWPKVNKAGPTFSNLGSCWEWTGATRYWGYGCIYAGPPHPRNKILVAHRVAWELSGNAPIPQGMVLDHICKNPRCVNPAHLRIVTPNENYTVFSDSVPAANLRKTHCKKGHPLSGDNLAVLEKTYASGYKGKQRVCLTCRPSARRHPLKIAA